MASSKMRFSLFAATFIAAAVITSGARAACQDLEVAFDRAIAARSVGAASRALDAIGDDIVCGARVDEFRSKFAEFLVAYIAADHTPDRSRATLMAERTLESIRNWQVAEKLADDFMESGDKVNAHHWYEQTVSFLKANPGIGATAIERDRLITKLAAAQSLANDDQEGNKTIAFVPTTREIDGSLGGIYSDVLLRGHRGAEVVSVPVPINFYSNETRFTPTGERALQELLEAVQEQRVRTLRLVGHADPRGAPQYNMDLSRRRVEAVRDELRRRGIAADIMIDWKGAQQPFNVDVLPYKPSPEEIWQLDRRVEWAREALP
jgi:outer membrane protein OmpA-like peptidoglycan-associated protein